MNEVTVKAPGQMEMLSVSDIATRLGMVKEIMNAIMKGPTEDNPNGTHYGLIPGCGAKPSLFQPGAQVLGTTFQLYANPVDEQIIELPNGHIEVRTRVDILQIGTDKRVGVGVSSCSTMEKKYRYRKGDAKVTPLEDPIPRDAKENKEAYYKKGFCMKKIDGAWKWCKIEGSEEQIEHENPYDFHNTVRKMAFKRAYVHGIINATACSDIFTQDVEDMAEVIRAGSQFVDASPAPYNKPPEEKPVEQLKKEQKPRAIPTPTPEPEKAPQAKPEGSRPSERVELTDMEIPEVKKPVPTSVPMDNATKGKIKGCFLSLSPRLNDEWFNKMAPEPTAEMRKEFLAAFNGINTQRISLRDAENAVSLEDLVALLHA